MSDLPLGTTLSTPLHNAASNRMESWVVDLIEYLNIRKANTRKKPKSWSEKKFFEEPFRSMSKKAIINAQDFNGDTVLHLAATSSSMYAAVEILLKNGANPCLQNRKGFTPLHTAILAPSDWHQRKIIELLARYKQCLNVRDYGGQSPLHIMVKKSYRSMVEVLLKNGASANIQNLVGETPLHCLVFHKSESECLDIAKVLIENGAEINMRNNYLETPLHLFSKNVYPHLRTALFLIDSGASLDAQDYLNNSPLHYTTAQCGEGYFIKDFESEDFAPQLTIIGDCAMVLTTKLLDCGAKPDIRNCKGKIPLHNAVKWGNVEMIEKLIECGTAIDVYAFIKGSYKNPYELSPIRSRECPLNKYVIKLLIAKFNIKVYLTSYCISQDYIKECERELKKMKDTTVFESTKLSIVLSLQNNPYYLEKMDRVVNFDKFFQDKTLKSDFPLYWDILRNTYTKTKIRYLYLKSATEVLNELLKTVLPELVSRKIMNNLDNNDLEIFTKCN